jgi:hypothetical protein
MRGLVELAVPVGVFAASIFTILSGNALDAIFEEILSKTFKFEIKMRHVTRICGAVFALFSGYTVIADVFYLPKPNWDLFGLQKNGRNAEDTGGRSPEEALLPVPRAKITPLHDKLSHPITEASDNRLAALLEFADAWSNHRESVNTEALVSTLHALKQEDAPRLKSKHRAAINVLSQAETIIHAPEIGLTSETRGQIGIYILSSGKSSLNALVVDGLGKILKANKFFIVDRKSDAALIIDILDAAEMPPKPSPSGYKEGWEVEVIVSFQAVWAISLLPLFEEEEFTDTESSNDRDGLSNARDAALENVIRRIAKELSDKAAP